VQLAHAAAPAELGVERIEDLDAGADLAEFRQRRCVEKWLDLVLVLERYPGNVSTSTSTTSKYLTWDMSQAAWISRRSRPSVAVACGDAQ
jgi:hypothetical protein